MENLSVSITYIKIQKDYLKPAIDDRYIRIRVVILNGIKKLFLMLNYTDRGLIF